jgi:hypothetical protein
MYDRTKEPEYTPTAEYGIPLTIYYDKRSLRLNTVKYDQRELIGQKTLAKRDKNVSKT